MIIDGNRMPDGYAPNKMDFSTENVTLHIASVADPMLETVITPRSVFEGHIAPTATLGLDATQGSWMTIAVFDVPSTGNFAEFSGDATVTALRDGFPFALVKGSLRVINENATPLSFGPLRPGPDELEPRSVLRIIPGLDLLDATIGGLEFEIEFDGTKVSNPEPFPNGSAIHAAIATGPGSTGSRTRIVLVAPQGFTLSDQLQSIPQPIPGIGPLIDIAWTRVIEFVSAPPLILEITRRFDQTNFSILNLYVTDTEGNALIDDRTTPPTDSTGRFHLAVVNHEEELVDAYFE